mmetsp:Transcript_70591/g.195071  ORF Transcript_70591/g.195071 Transcript_70591/m.195071 type:complete len:228 (+) Transcript_70591:267-950(+)
MWNTSEYALYTLLFPCSRSSRFSSSALLTCLAKAGSRAVSGWPPLRRRRPARRGALIGSLRRSFQCASTRAGRIRVNIQAASLPLSSSLPPPPGPPPQPCAEPLPNRCGHRCRRPPATLRAADADEHAEGEFLREGLLPAVGGLAGAARPAASTRMRRARAAPVAAISASALPRAPLTSVMRSPGLTCRRGCRLFQSFVRPSFTARTKSVLPSEVSTSRPSSSPLFL